MKTHLQHWLIILLLLISLPSFSQIEPQEKSMWCWAACIQSALAQANVQQTQAEVVDRLTKNSANRPAFTWEVVKILQSYQFRAWEVDYPASTEQLIATLSLGWKLIALVNPANNPHVGHYIILQKVDADSSMILISDPVTGQSYWQSPHQLHDDWKWYYSVIVGTPLLMANHTNTKY